MYWIKFTPLLALNRVHINRNKSPVLCEIENSLSSIKEPMKHAAEPAA